MIVGEGATQFTLAAESLTCNRNGDTVTCTAPVAGQQLTVDLAYYDPDLPVLGSPCTARHGDRPVSCEPRLGFYGHASNSVGISDQLGVTKPELTRLRDAVPWWRTANEVQPDHRDPPREADPPAMGLRVSYPPMRIFLRTRSS